MQRDGHDEGGSGKDGVPGSAARKRGNGWAHPGRPEDRFEEEGCESKRHQVQRDTAHHLIGAEADRKERVDPGGRGSCQRAEEQARPGRSGEEGAGRGGEGPESHHAFEADVHDAGPLGENAAERREDERRSEFEDAVKHADHGGPPSGKERARSRKSSGEKNRGMATSSTAIPWISSAKLGWMPTNWRRVD